MMMELDNTRESLKQLTLEHDETTDELKKTKQSLSEVQSQMNEVLTEKILAGTLLELAKTNPSQLSIEDFNQVAIDCQNLSPKWEEIAKYLNIDITIVEGINERRGGRDTVWCLDELIVAWLRQPSPTKPKPSWRILCDAVYNRLLRQTPVAIAMQQGNATEAAKELEKDFDDLMKFLSSEISKINVVELRYQISDYFKEEEGTIDEVIEMHLMKIENYDKPSAILNHFIRHNFIGYVNYSLIKVFQEIANSPLLDKRIEEYEKDYQCFLELSLPQIHDAFQQCPDLRPDFPAGIPKFTIHLKSKWDGKSMFNLNEFLKHVNDSDGVDQLMIAKISRN